MYAANCRLPRAWRKSHETPGYAAKAFTRRFPASVAQAYHPQSYQCAWTEIACRSHPRLNGVSRPKSENEHHRPALVGPADQLEGPIGAQTGDEGSDGGVVRDAVAGEGNEGDLPTHGDDMKAAIRIEAIKADKSRHPPAPRAGREDRG